ncbi:hypothetical protein EIN_075370 [Entamoeba invadens IP1]|uniref:Leucine rich repeat containing protein BspA family protein n=1 Tax=Entamoeba invadens IP1 TaxID=370355 RepID=A0A0A1TW76_ENTIV|nr:hypothetical protein EIN_075370 [Entamoeba invadens IP1]ELP84778.1 hypothetical protein EIN_075370 [Entamoeba invadens IP1]|eukprot:XP_004184124.1 hypothetical protein EIN_075370 [Entamoeba invadens IP1]
MAKSGVTELEIKENVTYGTKIFQGCQNLTTVTVVGTQAVISNNMFYHCRNLNNVKNMENIYKFGVGAFAETGKTTTKLNNHVEDGDVSLFENCNSLKTVDLNNVVNIPSKFFSGCSSLSTVIGIDSVTVFGNYSFAYTALSSFIASSDLNEIKEYAFAHSKLQTTTLKNVIEHIGTYAFYDCEELTFVDLKGLLEIPAGTFKDCSVLKTVTGFENITSFGNFSFANTSLEKVIINTQSSVTLGSNFFQNCKWLMDVNLGAINSLPDYTFDNCVLLKQKPESADSDHINFESFNTINTFGRYSMRGTGLTKISLINGNTYIINEGAFANITSLTSVNFGTNTLAIPNYLFLGCTFLKTVEGIEKITSFGDYAFANTGITSFDYTDLTVTTLSVGLFAGCKYLNKITLPNSITSLPAYFFKNCVSLTLDNINGFNQVNSFGKYSMSGMQFTDLVFNSTKIYQFSEGAFKNCEKLVNVTLGNIKAITKFMFDGCTSLKTVDGLDNVNYFGDYSMRSTKITQIKFSSGFEFPNLTEGIFQNCTELISADVKVLYYLTAHLFEGCIKLTNLSNTDYLWSVDANSLAYTNLSNISFINRFEIINSGVFEGTKIKSVDLSTISTLSKNAFKNCELLSEVNNMDAVVNYNIGMLENTNITEFTLSKTEIKSYPTQLTNEETIFGTTKIRKVTNKGIKIIKSRLFRNIETLTEIVGFENVHFEDNSFENTGLVTLTLNSLQSFGKEVFKGCKKLKKVDFGGLQYVANGMFKDCIELDELVNIQNIKYIDEHAFNGCTKLTQIQLNNVVYIQSLAFSNDLLFVFSNVVNKVFGSEDSFDPTTRVYVSKRYTDNYFANIFIGKISCGANEYFNNSINPPICSNCLTGTYAVEGASAFCSPDLNGCFANDSNCAVCNNSICSTCNSNYSLNNEGKCVSFNCGDGVFTNGKCVVD